MTRRLRILRSAFGCPCTFDPPPPSFPFSFALRPFCCPCGHVLLYQSDLPGEGFFCDKKLESMTASKWYRISVRPVVDSPYLLSTLLFVSRAQTRPTTSRENEIVSIVSVSSLEYDFADRSPLYRRYE